MSPLLSLYYVWRQGYLRVYHGHNLRANTVQSTEAYLERIEV